MSSSAVWASTAAASETQPRRQALSVLGDRRRAARYMGGLGLLIGLYYGSAKLGFALQFSGPVGALAWLPVGVAAAFLALFGLEFWPGALVADLIVNNELTLPVAGALGQTLGNVLEVVVIAWLLRRWLWRESSPNGVGDVTWIVVAIAIGTAISAIIGPLSLWIAGTISRDALWNVVRTWWLGDFCGALVIVPLALVWRHFPVGRSRRRLLEGAVLICAVGGLSVAAAAVGPPLTYIVFPVLAWTVFRFGMRGGTVAILVAVIATVVTDNGINGAFSSNSFAHSVLSTQLFVVVTTLSTLAFAAVVQEQHGLEDRLAASRARAAHAAELERSRIERDLHDGAQQRLLAMALRFGLAAERESVTVDEAQMLFADGRNELETAIDELRELSHGTHPRILRELGLSGALHSLAMRSAVPVTVSEVPLFRLDQAAEAAAYYVAVEAVANVHKHARASSIRIDVAYVVPWLQVAVRDNGCGGARETDGSGLAGLRDRVESLDGEFTLTSGGRGTTVAARLPALQA